jgi:hypothetical protein
MSRIVLFQAAMFVLFLSSTLYSGEMDGNESHFELAMSEVDADSN